MAQLRSCKKCENTGVIEKDDKYIECQCAYVRRLVSSMPAYIRKTQVVKEHLSIPIIKDWRHHYMVSSSWADMRAVIKAWMILNDTKRLQITSDREIKEVFVGNKSRSDTDVEYLTARYESIEDLVDSADLLIIKLNELGYKNKAAPGALEEALNYRIDRDKITWIYNDARRPFGHTSFCYSEAVADLIASTYKSVVITPIIKDVDFSGGVITNIMPSTIMNTHVQSSVIEPVLEPEYTTEPRFEPKPKTSKYKKKEATFEENNTEPNANREDVDLSSIYGAGIKKKKFR